MASETSKGDPDVWRLRSAGLYMRADDTKAGNLVRLVDVVLWLMHEDGKAMPSSEAIQVVSEGLRRICMVQVYRAFPDKRAVLVNGNTALRPDDDGDMDGFFKNPAVILNIPADWLEARKAAPKGRYRLAIVDDPVSPPQPPRRAAYVVADYIRSEWSCEFMDSGADRAFDLAVLEADANELWGWGDVAEQSQLDESLPTNRAELIKHVTELRKAGRRVVWGPLIELLTAWFKELDGHKAGHQTDALEKIAAALNAVVKGTTSVENLRKVLGRARKRTDKEKRSEQDHESQQPKQPKAA